MPLLAYNPKLKARNVTEVVSNRQAASTLWKARGAAMLDSILTLCFGKKSVVYLSVCNKSREITSVVKEKENAGTAVASSL